MTFADYPGGFPTSYVKHEDPGNLGLVPEAGGLRGKSSGTLRAGDGTSGTYTSTWLENRVAASKVVCKGVTYRDLWVGETAELITQVDLSGWGHAQLVTVGHVVVYPSSRNGSSPSVCDDATGGTFQFTFTTGPITQLMSGNWHWEKGDRLVFDPPVRPAASPA